MASLPYFPLGLRSAVDSGGKKKIIWAQPAEVMREGLWGGQQVGSWTRWRQVNQCVRSLECTSEDTLLSCFSAVITFGAIFTSSLVFSLKTEKYHGLSALALKGYPKVRARRHGNSSRWKCSQAGSQGGNKSISQGWEADQPSYCVPRERRSGS